MANQVHEAGKKQLLLFRIWPLCSPGVLLLTLLFVALTVAAALDYAWVVALVLGGVAVLLIIQQLQQCAAATAAALGTLQELREEHNIRDRQELRSDVDPP
jgi:hypothetical protein